MREDKNALQTDSFTVGNEPVSFAWEAMPNELYKIELETDESKISDDDEGFFVTVNDYPYELTDFTHVGDNRYSMLFITEDTDKIIQDDIQIKSKKELTVNSLHIASMLNTSPEELLDEPIKFSGDGVEDCVMYPVTVKPWYVCSLEVELANADQLTDDDEVCCCIYYEKRFNHTISNCKITKNENKFFIAAGDVTIATGPVYVKIHGKSSEELEINSIKLGMVEQNRYLLRNYSTEEGSASQ
jgi:hypothetical protein